MRGIQNSEATELSLSLLVLSRNLAKEQGSGHTGCVMEKDKGDKKRGDIRLKGQKKLNVKLFGRFYIGRHEPICE